jgi:ribonucleoside-diphosphate reductase alpha chain
MIKIEEKSSELVLSNQAQVVLKHRYFLKNDDGKIIENGEELFRRVSTAIAAVETKHMTLPVESNLLALDFFTMMQNLEFLPNSPTLMNAGTYQGTLSACFVLPLEDSMEGIMKAAHDSAMVQKFGGGTGFALSKIRPRGDKIKSTHGIACGPIEVLKTLSRVSSMITQGGKRDGANMAIMSVYHPDIIDFINCKSVEGTIHNFNISVGVDNHWMDCVENNLEFSLINPSTNAVVGKLNAREVFEKIVKGAWKNGEPGMVFFDQVNKDNNVQDTFGSIIATNPCGEQPLLGNESCNLGSINLAKFFKSGVWSSNLGEWTDLIDWKRLEAVTKLGIHFLDNVIDGNYYATTEIEQMTKATRKVGLGVMGFADLLIQLRIPYDSPVALEVGEKVMCQIRGWADEESLRLGTLRGTFPAWDESSLFPHTPYRNSCRLTVAPTGTISMISDTSSGIEPTFALVWKKQNILEGKTLNYANKYFELDAKEYGFYSDELMTYLSTGGSLRDIPVSYNVPNWAKEVYVTAPEISPEAHVNMQAAFQKYVDSGISKTINFHNTATVEDVENAYLLAWKSACKGITVYRAGSREQEVMVKGNEDVLSDVQNDACCENPYVVMESGCEVCKSCGWSACIIS